MPPFPLTEQELSQFMALMWMWLTPFILTISALVIFIRNTTECRWDRRMSRASFLLMLSYAVLMDRIILRNAGLIHSNTAAQGGVPELPFTTFYTFCTVYYGFALLIEHVLPFVFRMIRGAPPEHTPEGIPDDAESL